MSLLHYLAEKYDRLSKYEWALIKGHFDVNYNVEKRLDAESLGQHTATLSIIARDDEEARKLANKEYSGTYGLSKSWSIAQTGSEVVHTVNWDNSRIQTAWKTQLEQSCAVRFRPTGTSQFVPLFERWAEVYLVRLSVPDGSIRVEGREITFNFEWEVMAVPAETESSSLASELFQLQAEVDSWPDSQLNPAPPEVALAVDEELREEFGW